MTCDNLKSVSPDSFSASDLSTITTSDFQSCLSTLGSSDNSYSTDQLNALLTIAINSGANVCIHYEILDMCSYFQNNFSSNFINK